MHVGHRWLWATHKWLQAWRVYPDLAMANYVAQVVDLSLKKCTFIHIHILLVSAKAGQDGTEVVQVLLKATTIHKDVAEVQYYTVISTPKKTWLINLWKVDRALVSLKGITIHLKKPYLVKNMLQCWWSGVILT